MSYSDLIEKIKTLPDAKQAEVFDFVDYLTIGRNIAVCGARSTETRS